MQIVDLATGTGANLRYLAPRLGGAQSWLLVDRDPALLAELAVRIAAFDGRVRLLALDLAAALDQLPLVERELVTASALLDLVSASWLQRLAERCADAGAAVLFALTYDGRIEWSPGEPEDARVCELVNRHQRGDKGFGPALGPSAAAATEACFARLGYDVRQARSDWNLGRDAGALQAALVRAWVSVAAELAPDRACALLGWARRRLAHIAAGASTLRVGHIDLLGRPEPRPKFLLRSDDISL